MSRLKYDKLIVTKLKENVVEAAWTPPIRTAAKGRGGRILFLDSEVVPGVVYVDHGARYDPIVPGEIDRGGAINTITPHNLTSKNAAGMVVSGFLVEVKKANLDELRKKYPEAFKREYDPGAGLRFNAWIEGGKK